MLETIGITKQNQKAFLDIIIPLDMEMSDSETANPARVIVYNDCIINSSRYDNELEKGEVRNIVIKGEPERIDAYLQL